MPRIVDSDARRDQIVDAAVKLLSDGGFPRLTLSNLARELGGSIRLITHYFRDRQDLITALLENGLRDTETILAELAAIDDEEQRLRFALEWFLPTEDADLQLERVRIALVPYKEVEPVITNFFAKVDGAMRKVIRSALPGRLVGPRQDLAVDIIRAWTSGLALASVEHPEIWTAQRQHEATDALLDSFRRL